MSAAILALVALPLLLQRWRSNPQQLRDELKRSGILALVLLVCLIKSFSMNGRFQVALNSASFGLVNFVSKSLGNLDDKSLVELEKESSTAARIFLLICSFRIYQTGPSLGQGIEIAHSLAPHNCCLPLPLVLLGG